MMKRSNLLIAVEAAAIGLVLPAEAGGVEVIEETRIRSVTFDDGSLAEQLADPAFVHSRMRDRRRFIVSVRRRVFIIGSVGLTVGLVLLVVVRAEELKRWFISQWDLPPGVMGWLFGAFMTTGMEELYRPTADYARLTSDDELLDVACGGGAFLDRYVSEVGYVAGIIRSDIQLKLARRLLGTAAGGAGGTARGRRFGVALRRQPVHRHHLCVGVGVLRRPRSSGRRNVAGSAPGSVTGSDWTTCLRTKSANCSKAQAVPPLKSPIQQA
jgi:hypothetical protein